MCIFRQRNIQGLCFTESHIFGSILFPQAEVGQTLLVFTGVSDDFVFGQQGVQQLFEQWQIGILGRPLAVNLADGLHIIAEGCSGSFYHVKAYLSTETLA